jgi:hypothetical protein
MPARESDAHYYLRRLECVLPSSVGDPLIPPVINDLSIRSDYGFFNDVAERVKAAYELNPDEPTLPGLEPNPIDPRELAEKQRRAVAAARSRKSADALLQIMVTTFNEDTARSTYRYLKLGDFIPVNPDDTPDSLFVRSADYVEDIFVAVALRRVVPSSHTRDKGERVLRAAFAARESETVLPLTTYAARNNARLRGVWLAQLELTSQGLRFIPSAARIEFNEYMNSRPLTYLEKPNLHSLIAGLHRRNTGRHARSA